MIFCISCGKQFTPPDTKTVICPECTGQPDAVGEDVLYEGPPNASIHNQPKPYPQPLPTLRSTVKKSGPHPQSLSKMERGEWKEGDTILDTYEVKEKLGEGGFGKVYRVHHKSWDVDLAVKRSLRLEEASKQAFIDEAEKWVDLGLHPNVLTCYYVRTIDGFPHTFAELAEGGSLKAWIDDRRLYAGGKVRSLERILDISIQFAWGLAYAHEKGLVHQDVKPGNVLMAGEGADKDSVPAHPIAKVSDFGLARARTATDGTVIAQQGSDHLVIAAAGTPSFRSPEQIPGAYISFKTDIWSWAVSILEMFTGEATWYSGVAALEALEDFLSNNQTDGPCPLPSALSDLLRQCFRRNPAERPKDMLELASRLQEVYKQETGQPYHRQAPKPAELRADSLNNKALSFLDLGRETAAVDAWREALRLNPSHLEATFNLGYWEWTHGKCDDLRYWQSMAELEASNGERPTYWSALAQLSQARGDLDRAGQYSQKAARLGGKPAPTQDRSDIHLKDVIRTPNGLYCMRLSPDGRFILTGGLDKSMRMYDLHTKQIVQTYLSENNHGEIFVVGVTPNWGVVLCESLAHYIEAWETSSGEHIFTFHDKNVSASSAANLSALEFTPDGRMMISAIREDWALGEMQGIHLWDMSTGKLVGSLDGYPNRVYSLVITPDGQQVVSSGWSDSGKYIKRWDIASRRCLQTLEGQPGPVYCLAISVDGRYLLSGSEDGSVGYWDLRSGSLLQVLTGHNAAVRSVAFYPDGRFALSGGEDRTIRFWDLQSGVCLRTLSEHANTVSAVLFSADGALAYSASKDASIRIYAARLSHQHDCDFMVSFPVSAEKTLQHQDRLAEMLEQADREIQSGHYEKGYLLLRQAQEVPGFEKARPVLDRLNQTAARGATRRGLRSAWLLQTMSGHGDAITQVNFSPDGELAASASTDRTVRLWDLQTGACKAQLEGHRRPVFTAVFSPAGDLLATASKGGYMSDKDADSYLRLWQVKGTQQVHDFQKFGVGVSAAAFSPDGGRLFTAITETIDKEETFSIQALDVRSGARLRTFTGHSGVVTCLEVFGEGKFLISGSRDHTLKIWRVENGELIRTLEGHQGSIQALATLPGGHYVLSGGVDNLLRIWDIQKGACVRELTGHKDTIQTIAVTQDGWFALTGGEEYFLLLWDLHTGAVLQKLEGHSDGISSVAFSNDGRYALSGSYDKTLKLWEIDWEWSF